MSFADKNIWVIGASSGIGRALAIELGRRGAVLALSARNEERLEALAHELNKTTVIKPLDVTDSAAFDVAAQELSQKLGRIDGVILMSGIYTPGSAFSLDKTAARNIVEVNLMGTVNCIQAVLPFLRAQKSGQLALCGSVAGYRGLPHAQPYSATKAAIISLAESLRAEERNNGIDVRLINPGFVKTPMTDKNSFPMPFIITPEAAAKKIADGLAGNSFEIHFPKKFTLLMKFLRVLPDWVYFKITGVP